MKEEKRGKQNTKRKWAFSIWIVMLCIYAGGFFYFSFHFLPKTQINGIICGGKKVSQIEALIRQEAEAYKLIINGRNNVSDQISAAEIELHPVFDGTITKILKTQKSFLWPVVIWKQHYYETETVVAYDEQLFQKRLKNTVFALKQNQKKPVNAYLSDITDDGYKIIPEDKGTAIDSKKYEEKIEEAVLTLADDISLEENDIYEKAAITQDDKELVELCDNLNYFVKNEIVYHFGEDVVRTTPQIIAEWINIDGQGKIEIQPDKVREFVNDMARKYDSFGKKRSFTTHTGEKIEITEGTYGWWMNRAEETNELVEWMEEGKSGDKTPNYYAVAAQYGPNDWGDTYVEIDLTEQHLYFYKEGTVILDSDFVSGNVSKGYGTPCGIYGITYKERNATLQGRGYSSPVSYWMPFNHNVGMHDASWRKEFGKEIYLRNGSHGCINLPKAMAEKIFEVIEKNTPVIVYGGKNIPVETNQEAVPEQPETVGIEESAVVQENTVDYTVVDYTADNTLENTVNSTGENQGQTAE